MKNKPFWMLLLLVLALTAGLTFAVYKSGIMLPLFDRSLERIGGTQLVLRVVTDEALDQELMIDLAAIEDELQINRLHMPIQRRLRLIALK
jgi:hypothetical protein